MKRHQCRGAYGNGELSDAFWTEEERPESAEQPVVQPQAGRPFASTAQDDQLLPEQKILRDHRSHATGARQPRDRHGQVQQREQEILHARVSVGQTYGAAQRCSIVDSARELAIRDPVVCGNSADGLGGLAIVELEHAAEPLTASYWARSE